MANIHSAIKNIRKSRRNEARRKKTERILEKSLKTFRLKGDSKDTGGLQKLLDKAAAHGVIKPNKARRLKSKIMRAGRK